MTPADLLVASIILLASVDTASSHQSHLADTDAIRIEKEHDTTKRSQVQDNYSCDELPRRNFSFLLASLHSAYSLNERLQKKRSVCFMGSYSRLELREFK